MNTKTAKIIYWTGVILTSMWFGTSGVCELTRNPIVWDITLQLGYPAHFIYILGVAKLSGVAVLLAPNRWLRLKEWVFAGIFFDILFAFFSKLSVLGFPATIDAIVAFFMVSVTYIMFRRLYPATHAMANTGQRRFLMAAALTIAAALGGVNDLKAQSNMHMNNSSNRAQTSFDEIKQVKAGVLDIGYAEVGAAGGEPVILLHGWPYDIHSYTEVSALLAAKGYRVLVPYLRGYGTTRFLDAATPRNGQQAALAVDVIEFMNALKIDKAIIGGFDWGARTANIVAALWPERCKALVSVSGYLIGSQQANKSPLPPKAELSWWYQFYFATERGRAGYDANRRDFAKLIWQTASPDWHFEDAVFARSAASFDNPDHVAIVIHNYRWRLGLAEGESKYDELEKKLAAAPVISVPTVTLEGDANGAPHPDPKAYAAKFTGKYAHHTITGGIGHNLPQEAPKAFADAVIEAGGLGGM